MNIETRDRSVDDYPEDLIFLIAEELGEISGINIDDNCSIDELANLLTEIENHFDGDVAAALAAIRAGNLQFEERHCHNAATDWLEWHIKANRQ